MISILASAILIAAAVLNVEADFLPYYDPPSPWVPSYSYAFKGASSILREQGERLLLTDSDSPHRATYVIVLINRRFDEVYSELRSLVRERWGISEEHNNARGRIPTAPGQIVRADLEWPILGEGLSFLQASESAITARECQLISQRYNNVASLNGYSQAVIRVSDGAEVFQSSVTILQLTRSDWSQEWVRSGFHGLFPLPYKEERRSLGVVTSSEIALIEELKEDHPRTTIRYFVLPGPLDPKRGQLLQKKMQEAVDLLKGRGKVDK
jgi:hypothetical protein